MVIEPSPRSKSLLEQLKAVQPPEQQQPTGGMQQFSMQTTPVTSSGQEVPNTEQPEDELNSSTDFFTFKKKDIKDQSGLLPSGTPQTGLLLSSTPQTGLPHTGVQSDFTTQAGLQSSQALSYPSSSQQFQTGTQSFPDLMTGSMMSSAQQLQQQQQQQQMLQRHQQIKQQQFMKQLQRQQQMFQRQQQQLQQQLHQQLQQPLIPEAQV